MTNYMFRPSGGHHQVLNKFGEERTCYFTFPLVVNPSLYSTNCENFWASKRPLDLEVGPQSHIHDVWNIGEP
jgi:hypothetical protein